MRRVLLTGGAGFIGHRLVGKLSESGSAVTIVDNLSNANLNFLDQVKKAIRSSSSRAGFVRLRPDDHRSPSLYIQDIRNKEALEEIVRAEEIDTCIHLAAKIDVAESVKNPEETIDVNIKGTYNILEACAKGGVKNFMFASSSAVYGESKALPIPEEQQLNPLSPYGASKIAGEALVSSFCNTSKIQNGLSLRIFNVYGAGQSTKYAGVIAKFAERFSSRLPPVLYGDGSQVRDFIFIEDVVNTILLATNGNKMEKASHEKVINVGTGKAMKIKDLAQIMAKIFAVEYNPIFAESKNGDIINSIADISKLKTILEYVPSNDMEICLEKIFIDK
jgi:UDP-glucose 4-epimerase